MTANYHLGLLYLVRLLIDADGITDTMELAALQAIKDRENIPEEIFEQFEEEARGLSYQELYTAGIDLINACSYEEKLRTFGVLYRLSEVDGRVHLKEIRLLLNSIKTAGLEFDAVVNVAKAMPVIL
ncbi:hypothetical protein [Dawidia soli]|uniref:Co-chaperone DjlA N-terminal domain-containing protein n=1 Tax=Dawidia soli TaxID=2782352 RepID=A0AAP2GGB9_9BACT|nr:hypothetical protein [Dawidia soli]MBT1685355.1 hypothetical protein [Dawidia soli]